MHGAGSPQAQRVQIARQSQLELKKALARELAGIDEDDGNDTDAEPRDYLGRVFDTGD